MLKIEGKGSNQGPRYDYEYEMARKQADRDIRAELRKIYNLKPSPKKHSRRIVELPRLNWIIFDVVNHDNNFNNNITNAEKKWCLPLWDLGIISISIILPIQLAELSHEKTGYFYDERVHSQLNK